MRAVGFTRATLQPPPRGRPAAFIDALNTLCPDIILASNLLACFDGPSALETARKLCPGTPFIFVSGAMGEEVAIESLNLGATDYVLKERLQRLGPAVKRALAEARQVSDGEQAREELARKSRELAVLNADLEQFAYAASHDLQEPLRTVSLFSRLLANKYRAELDQRAHEYLTIIENGARQISALIHGLLVYTKLPGQPGEPAQADLNQVDLNKVLRETIELFSAAIRETGATITYDPLPTVFGKAGQLGLVLQNLISNALQYRGTLPPVVHIAAEKSSGHWVISVKDNGIGFEQNHADQVFSLFKRLNNRDFRGTGLGLAIARRAIDLHGGRIWASSKPGEGSTFFFSLPAAHSTSAAKA